jgi:hypothetical protein
MASSKGRTRGRRRMCLPCDGLCRERDGRLGREITWCSNSGGYMDEFIAAALRGDILGICRESHSVL